MELWPAVAVSSSAWMRGATGTGGGEAAGAKAATPAASNRVEGVEPQLLAVKANNRQAPERRKQRSINKWFEEVAGILAGKTRVIRGKRRRAHARVTLPHVGQQRLPDTFG